MSDLSQSCHELSEASEEELEVVTEFQPYSDEPLADDDADYVGEDSFCRFRCREITFLLYGIYEFCLFTYVLEVNVNIVAKKTSETHLSFAVATR